MRAKRLTRRTIGVVLGLALGWYAAGFIGVHMERSYAEEPHGPAGHETDHADAHHVEHANPAEALVPQEEIAWLRPVLWSAGGLFVAAIVLGIPALKLRGAEPPDPAATMDAHDDHGHDDHAHAGHGHGGGHH